MTRATTRTGRRPGSSGTRDAILGAARSRFAEHGFDRTSVRSIAADAGVDPALVHHYFGTKRALFLAAIAIPADPAMVLAGVADAPVEEIGERFLRAVVGVWESPHREGLLAAFRSAITGESVGLVRSFLTEVVLTEIGHRVDDPAGSAALRASLVASQMAGLMVTRYILELEPLATLPPERVVHLVAPTLQRYLTGDLG
ncbi:TetR family transcriptional regulator [Rhodococcus sp. NPDC058505]|uniref:TetR/AcrR family transcriptional regulator n=1 Tax=Rhodococcus sp. NPDC058505 TaxID=3346531 RepID=UPI003663941B